MRLDPLLALACTCFGLVLWRGEPAPELVSILGGWLFSVGAFSLLLWFVARRKLAELTQDEE